MNLKEPTYSNSTEDEILENEAPAQPEREREREREKCQTVGCLWQTNIHRPMKTIELA